MNVLVIDDDKITYALVEAAVGGLCTLAYRSSGEDALRDIDQVQPELVLLDIVMGDGLNGYETCRELRRYYSAEKMHIIFLSGLEREEEIFLAYEAGGDDYIVKPIPQKTLLKKFEAVERLLGHLHKTEVNLKSARSLVMNVMGISSELGQVIHYLNGCHKLDTYEDIAHATISLLTQWELHATVQVATQTNFIYDSWRGVVNPLEQRLLMAATESGRIQDIGARTFINFSNITVLIHNMPMDNPEKYGNFKDNIALLVEGANARIMALHNIKTLKSQHAILCQLVTDLTKAQNFQKDMTAENSLRFICMLDELEAHLEITFSYVDLSDTQEQNFRGILSEIRKCLADTESARDVVDQAIKMLSQVFQLPTSPEISSQLPRDTPSVAS